MGFFETEGMQYLIQYPKDFSASGTYPALFFFHGAGTRGTDMGNLTDNLFFEYYERHGDLPFVVIAPLCSENTWFDMWERIKRLVLHVTSLPFIDADHVYAMGASMGGYATWQIAMSMPEVFAAIVPICGGGMYWNASRLRNVPVWAFHGALDETVRCEESQKMVDRVNKRGNARLTVYPDAKHDSWSATYANREVFEWLLSNKRQTEAPAPTLEHEGSKAFG